MKKVIKSVVFLLIFVVSFYYIFTILWLPKRSIAYTLNEPDNTLDIVYIGASDVFSSFNTTLAYHEYGFTTGSLSASLEPFDLTKYLITEIRKNQNPKLYVIDLIQAVADETDYTDAHYRNIIDNMPFSRNRIDAINEVLKRTGEEDNLDLRLAYYFSFFKYHKRYRDVIAGVSREDKTLYKGFLLSENRVKTVPFSNYDWTYEKETIPELNKDVLNDLIKYIKENDLNVIFTITPRTFKEVTLKRLNDVVNILNENKFKVINANDLKDFSIDCEKDLIDYAHVNTKGATKFTLYFAKYLDSIYDLPDHRGDDRYNSWDLEYERLSKDYQKYTGNDYQELVNELNIY